jgi:hypothetical protein
MHAARPHSAPFEKKKLFENHVIILSLGCIIKSVIAITFKASK